MVGEEGEISVHKNKEMAYQNNLGIGKEFYCAKKDTMVEKREKVEW